VWLLQHQIAGGRNWGAASSALPVNMLLHPGCCFTLLSLWYQQLHTQHRASAQVSPSIYCWWLLCRWDN